MDDPLSGRVKKVMVEVLGVEESLLQPNARLGEDLDADELDLVELVMAVEEEFDINVAEEELDQFGGEGEQQFRLASRYMVLDQSGTFEMSGGTVGKFIEFVRERVLAK